MNMLKTVLAVTAVVALPSLALANVTVENKTEKTKTVTFDKGAEEVKHKLEAGAIVSEPCPDGCGVRFSGHDFMATDGDTLSITENATKPLPSSN